MAIGDVDVAIRTDDYIVWLIQKGPCPVTRNPWRTERQQHLTLRAELIYRVTLSCRVWILSKFGG